jgi:hypothetical protein
MENVLDHSYPLNEEQVMCHLYLQGFLKHDSSDTEERLFGLIKKLLSKSEKEYLTQQ